MKDQQIEKKIDELVKIYSEEIIRSIDDTHVNKIIKDCIHEAITFGQSLERERIENRIQNLTVPSHFSENWHDGFIYAINRVREALQANDNE